MLNWFTFKKVSNCALKSFAEPVHVFIRRLCSAVCPGVNSLLRQIKFFSEFVEAVALFFFCRFSDFNLHFVVPKM